MAQSSAEFRGVLFFPILWASIPRKKENGEVPSVVCLSWPELTGQSSSTKLLQPFDVLEVEFFHEKSPEIMH
jgi:hypothetical protein